MGAAKCFLEHWQEGRLAPLIARAKKNQTSVPFTFECFTSMHCEGEGFIQLAPENPQN